jgi:hypothetical protein
MLPVVIKDSAASDLQKAYEYLEEEKQGLGEKLLQGISEYIELIEPARADFVLEYVGKLVRAFYVKIINSLNKSNIR